MSKRILLVEDDVDLRDVTAMILSDAGYDVATAQDGRSALDQVAMQMPDLILLDMRMPGMSGWEFTQAFRSQYGQAAPIVALTASHGTAESAAEIQADGYLDKPFEMDELLAVVERYAGPV